VGPGRPLEREHGVEADPQLARVAHRGDPLEARVTGLDGASTRPWPRSAAAALSASDTADGSSIRTLSPAPALAHTRPDIVLRPLEEPVARRVEAVAHAAACPAAQALVATLRDVATGMI
jgi:hypothetical protein